MKTCPYCTKYLRRKEKCCNLDLSLLVKDYCSACFTPIPWSIRRYKRCGNHCGPCNLKFHRAGIRRAARERELEENNPTDVV